jgi:hypothetical protein
VKFMGVRQTLLGPEIVRASVVAYNTAVEIVAGSAGARRELSDSVRADMASAIISLAETGVTDPVQLADAALSRAKDAGTHFA